MGAANRSSGTNNNCANTTTDLFVSNTITVFEFKGQIQRLNPFRGDNYRGVLQ